MAESANNRAQSRDAQRTRLVKWISAAVTVAVLGLMLWGLLASRSASGTADPGRAAIPDFYGRAGKTATNFTLKDLTNTPVSLSDFRGKRVLLNFWYAACPGCQQEMTAFETFYAQAQNQQVVILGVNIVDDANTASQFMQQLGITYPVVLDTHQRVLDLYGVTSTPSSFFIDAQGIIRGSVSGPLTLEQIQTYFRAMR